MSSEEEVSGVRVDVLVITTTDSDEVGPTVMVEEVVNVVSEVVSLVVGMVVVESGVDVAESVVESLVPPVLKDTD